MNKLILKTVRAALALATVCLCLALCACGNFCAGTHSTHSFKEQNTADKYMKSPASCTSPSEYFYSCKCGEKGSETFTVGTAIAHRYENRICTVCGERSPSEGLEYISNGNGTCTVSGIGSCTDTDIIIPTLSPANERVTGIGDNAFKNCKSIVSVTAKEGITSIGSCAFAGCESLVKISLPKGVSTIKDSAFWDCAIVEIDIPYGIGFIENYVFMDCTSLEFVTVPDSVAAIAKTAFSNCTSLSKIVIGRSVHTIMKGAFDSAKIDTVYYRGGESEWKVLSDTFAEGTLADAEVLFFSENEPATAGNYWHYVDGVPTKW